jgi:hypothetical protein
MKYLIEPKICNGCGASHEDVPETAKRDKDLGGWHFECKNNCDLKSTMFVLDKRIDWDCQCNCEECIDDISVNECLSDCHCFGCREKWVVDAEWEKESRENR